MIGETLPSETGLIGGPGLIAQFGDDELEVRSLGRRRIVLRSLGQSCRLELFRAVEEHNGVRIGHRHAQRRTLTNAGNRHSRVVSGVAARQPVFAHVDCVDGAVEGNRLDAAPGRDVHGPARPEVDHALDPQVMHEHSQAVAAHLRD